MIECPRIGLKPEEVAVNWGNCNRCYEYEVGDRLSPWEFACTRCIKDEEWIQGIAALVREYEEPNGTDRGGI